MATGGATLPEDLWSLRADPILRYVQEQEGQIRVVSIGEIADATGLTAEQATVEVERLIASGFLTGPVTKSMGPTEGWLLVSPKLLEKGVRALGHWPDPGQRLIELIEARLASEEDQAGKAKWGKLLEVVRDLGVQTVSSLVVAAVTGQIH